MVTEGFDDFILDKVVEAGYYKGKQCVRNCRRDLEKLGIILQQKKRTYVINPELELNLGNVLYELKLLYVNQEEAH